MRDLPDPDLSFRDACDFVMESRLGRRALTAPDPANLAVFVRDILQTIYRLTNSCHLSEFTDHGVAHLCSLVDRLSRWSSNGADGTHSLVVARPDFSSQEASVLLLATLFHDIGMLSQRVEDMPVVPGVQPTRPISNTSSWVRTTHIERLENLVRFLFENTEHSSIIQQPVVQRAFKVARAHGKWPWDWPALQFDQRDAGLAAMLAVTDLLDEDALRCDSETLLRHRQGSSLNRAHWIRHGLTTDRVLVQEGIVSVVLSIPPHTTTAFDVVFSALRNHYRLVLLYGDELQRVNATIANVTFDPASGLCNRVAADLADWWNLPGFVTEAAMIYHLLSSFMPEALWDAARLSPETMARLSHLGMDAIDLTKVYEVRNTMSPRGAAEENFYALLPG